MNRRITGFIMTLIMSLTYICAVSVNAQQREMRGVWVATAYNIDYPSTQGLSMEQLKSEADNIINNCSDIGFNTIFLQVRPSSDAIYPSEIYPMSKYITGSQNTELSEDLLKYWIDKSHEKGIELHAWINPYRVTAGGENEFNTLSENNPAKLHTDWLIKYDNNYYFNPGLPEVRELVKSGVEELCTNYEIDGIHFDDYFYPGKDIDDAAAYSTYGAEFTSIDDWRRDNVDILVKEIGEAVRSYNKTFGISPGGIWANASQVSGGSDTAGYSSYTERYADSLKWAKEEYVDYIAPQIYWEKGNKAADFKILLDWWTNQLKDSNTELYIGLPDYKTIGVSQDSHWYGGEEIARQMTFISQNEVVDGAIHYSYNSLQKDETLKKIVRSKYNDELIICLDPGHGGSGEPGAVNSDGTIIEKNIALEVAKYTKEELEKYEGVTVTMTRTDDSEVLSRKERLKRALDFEADVLISQHFNSESGNTAEGAVIIPSVLDEYYPVELADKFLVELEKNGLNITRGIYRRPSSDTTLFDGRKADYYGIMLYGCASGIPSMIVEHAFLSNYYDEKFYNSPEALKKLGIADATALAQYYGLERKAEYPNPTVVEINYDITLKEGAKSVAAAYYDKQSNLVGAKLFDVENQSGIFEAQQVVDHAPEGAAFARCGVSYGADIPADDLVRVDW